MADVTVSDVIMLIQAEARNTLATVRAQILDATDRISRFIVDVVADLVSEFNDLYRWVNEVVITLNNTISTFNTTLTNIIDSTGEWLKSVYETVKDRITAAITRIGDEIEKVYFRTKDAIVMAFELVNKNIQATLEWVGETLHTLWKEIERGFELFVRQLVIYIQGSAASIKDAWEVFKDTVVNVYESVRDWIVNAYEVVSKWIARVGEDIASAIDGTITGLIELISPVIQWLIGEVDKPPEKLVEGIASILEPMVELQLAISERLAKKVLYTGG